MDNVTSGKIDIYAQLGVAPDASASEISRKYRKLALQYHPDKNSSADAASKFQLFSEINTVLQDPGLRRKYDEIRAHRVSAPSSSAASDAVHDQILQFKEALRKREKEAALSRFQASRVKANLGTQNGHAGTQKHGVSPGVEALAMRGLALRRQFQTKLQQNQTTPYLSFRDIPAPKYTDAFLVKDVAVEVTWKYRAESGAQIDEATLRLVMNRFGPVKSCEVRGQTHDGRYVKGVVTFEQSGDAERALSYDYRSARLWDGTGERKLASLLRGAARGDHGGEIAGAEDLDRFLGEFASMREGVGA
ncbi:hypothetical protein JCM33374_g2220 [Metschnikowia sp. JCM 33374]|nr:hypothetical protein JCM33374_g2220 [Metschnikowia sp. JCM 33374]